MPANSVRLTAPLEFAGRLVFDVTDILYKALGLPHTERDEGEEKNRTTDFASHGLSRLS